MAHTPTPWLLGRNNKIVAKCTSGVTGRQITVKVASASKTEIPGEQSENAAFIVRAVNSHDALLAALERIAKVPCNCAGDKLPSDECESCIARETLAKIGQ